MVSGTSTLDAAAVLAAAREFRREANAAEAGVLAKALEWAHLHEVDDLEDAATWMAGRGQDTGIPLAGEGAPLISEFAVCELATALGLSAGSGRNLVAQALELAHRLPKLWARVQSGSLAPWRARRIAEETHCLTPEAAAYVDQALAPFAHRTGPVQTQRTVDEAIARFMPEFARHRRDRAADQRHFDIDTDQVSFAGTTRLHGELELADALDLEDAIRAGAAQLKDLGSEDTLDVRRAAALGVLARGEQALDLQGAGASTGSTSGGRVSTGSGERRDIVLYVHLSEDAIKNGDGDAVVRLENAGGHLLTAGQVADWCGRDDTARVVVKPASTSTNRNQPTGTPPPLGSPRSSTSATRRACSRGANAPPGPATWNHIDPFDPDGPPGQTSSQDLAPLCRLHHRMKTHGGWGYTMVEPGVYLWRSPYGYAYLRDAGGTIDLTPEPVEPPTDPPERRTS